MRTRLVLSAVSVIAALAVAAPLAHAGGASGSSLDTSTTTVCRSLLNGGSAGQVMSLTADLAPALSQDLQIGAPVLLCDLHLTAGGGVLKKGADLLVPCDGATTGCYNPNSIVCYAVSGANKQKAPATVTSPFGEQSVQAGSLGLVCVTAETTSP